MANNPLDDERKVAEKLARLKAEEDAKAAAKAAAKAKAKNYEDKIRNKLYSQRDTESWCYEATKLFQEANSSDVKNLIDGNLLYDLCSRANRVRDNIWRKERKKEKIKNVFSIIPVVIVSLFAAAFVVYTWLSAETTLYFWIALGVDIAAAIIAIVVAIVHIAKDNDTVFKVICIIFAVINIALAVWIGLSGRLVKHDIIEGEDGFLYELVDGEYYLYGCESSVTELSISSLSENIVGISDDAFKGNTTLNALTVDVSNLVIGNCAFQECSSLTKVEFIGGDTVLNGRIFKNCKSLESVVFDGGSYTFNGSNIFDDCTRLKDIYMNEGSYTGTASASVLGGLGKIAVHHNNATIDIELKGADELTLVVYPGTDSIFTVKPDVLVFASGYDFSEDFYAERGTFDLGPYAPVTYFPQSVTYIPDILGSDRKNYNVYYQGSSDQWEGLHIAGDGGLFDVANMNYKEDHIKMHYNSNCRFWETNNVEMGN